MTWDGVDVVVVGGGVVGCAVAHALSRARRSVVLLEKGPRLGEGITSRNSGVIHSGLYYAPNSLKAQSCIRGNVLLYAWAAAKGVWHRKTGKLVVATHEGQREALEKLHANVVASGAPGCTLLPGNEVTRLEPSLQVAAAMMCAETGVVDPTELTHSLAIAAEEHGATILSHAAVHGLERGPDGWRVDSARGRVSTRWVVNAAGLDADRVACLAGVTAYQLHPCRGDYFRLSTAVEYRHLIYPVKDKRSAGLGVHLALDRGGGYRLGPDAEYVERRDDFSSAEHKLLAFHAAAQQLLGPLRVDQLRYDGCGIRPKLRAPDEPDEKDFVLCEDLPGFVNLVGIESPGLTASLDLAERVAALCR
ncbi:MAG: NAD(P)/FAD-dependent oxidoreductase [Myxococcota bacterium]